MNKSVKTLAAVAIGSLIMGANAPTAFAGEHAATAEAHKSACNGKDGCKGAAAAGEHHDKDSCKGKDGCKGKESCKGKDSCKDKEGKDSCKSKESCKHAEHHDAH